MSRNIVVIALAICLTGITGLLAGNTILNAMRAPGFDRSSQSPEERFNLGRNAFVTPTLSPKPTPIELNYSQSGPGRVLQPYEPARKRERLIMASYEADRYWTGQDNVNYDIADPVSVRDYDVSGPAYTESYDNRDHVTDFDRTVLGKAADAAERIASADAAPVNIQRGSTAKTERSRAKKVVIPDKVTPIASPRLAPDLAASLPAAPNKVEKSQERLQIGP